MRMRQAGHAQQLPPLQPHQRCAVRYSQSRKPRFHSLPEDPYLATSSFDLIFGFSAQGLVGLSDALFCKYNFKSRLKTIEKSKTTKHDKSPRAIHPTSRPYSSSQHTYKTRRHGPLKYLIILFNLHLKIRLLYYLLRIAFPAYDILPELPLRKEQHTMDKLLPKYRNRLLLLRCSQSLPGHSLPYSDNHDHYPYLLSFQIARMGQSFPPDYYSPSRKC